MTQPAAYTRPPVLTRRFIAQGIRTELSRRCDTVGRRPARVQSVLAQLADTYAQLAAEAAITTGQLDGYWLYAYELCDRTYRVRSFAELRAELTVTDPADRI